MAIDLSLLPGSEISQSQHSQRPRWAPTSQQRRLCFLLTSFCSDSTRFYLCLNARGSGVLLVSVVISILEATTVSKYN